MKQENITWYDVSEIKGWEGHFTGIQRVVFSLGKELINNPALNMRLCRYDRLRKVFIETDYDFTEPQYEAPAPQEKMLVGHKPKTVDYIRKVIGTALPKPIKKTIKAATSFNTWPFVSFDTPVVFSKSDTLIIPGAFWTGSLQPLIGMKKSDKPRVFSIMYDMVPVLFPHFCTEVTVMNFTKEIKRAIEVVDKWLSISENTKRDLLDYTQKIKIAISPQSIDVIKLGSDINIKGPSCSPFGNQDQPKDFVLFVSTIEARKNQQLVYQAVKRAEELGAALPTIILVGKHGWYANDIASLLRNDPSLKDKIIWLEDVDDRSLRWLYKNCLFTVYPSIYEGWGLPVAESVAYGKFALASNTSSIPEIAGDFIEYFSPYSADEFVTKMNEYFTDRQKLQVREKALQKVTQPSWVTISQEVATVLLRR